MKIAIFSMNVAGIYSGGRYLSLIMAYALSRAGAEVDYYTNLVPAFQDDFKSMNQTHPVLMVAQESWPDGGDPQVEWVIVVPTGNIADDFYSRAKRFAQRSGAKIALLSFETANWFNALVSPPKSPLPWEGWAGVVSEGGLVLTIADQGVDFAKAFYSDVIPEASLEYDFWHPAINDDVATSIEWQSIPVYPNRIVSFIRTSDQHKGANELLSFPEAFFRNKTICLIFGRGIDREFVRALISHTSAISGCTILAFDRVTDEEKLALVASSSALLFTSYFEGFGYPPIEAAYVGTPTVAFDLPVLRETMGDTATFVQPGDIQRLAVELHQVATSRPGIVNRIPTPARCESKTSGERLIESLNRASLALKSKCLAYSDGASQTSPAWEDQQNYWIWCEARYAGAGSIRIRGSVSALLTDRPFEVRANGIRIEDITGAYDKTIQGTLLFDLQIPIGLSSTNASLVEIEVRRNGSVQHTQSVCAAVDSALRLTNRFWVGGADMVKHSTAVLSVASDDFGISLPSRLGLASLATQLILMNQRTILIAPNSVIHRLAADDMLTGLFSQVLDTNSSIDRSDIAYEVSISESDMSSDSLIEVRSDSDSKEARRLTLTFNCKAPMISHANERYLSSLSLLAGENIDTEDIYLVNCFSHGRISSQTHQLIHAILALSASEGRVSLHCIAPNEAGVSSASKRVSIPRNTNIISASDFILRAGKEDSTIVNCGASSAHFDTAGLRTMLRAAHTLALTDFDDISSAAKTILAKAAANPEPDDSRFHLLETVAENMELTLPDAALFKKRLATLVHARRVANSFICSEAGAADAPFMPPIISKHSLFTEHSKFKLSSLVRGSSHRTVATSLGFRSSSPAFFDFRCPPQTQSLTVDFLIFSKALSRSKSNITVCLDGAQSIALEIPSRKYHRVTCVFELPKKPTLFEQHQVKISVTDADVNETYRIRAMALVPDCSPQTLEPAKMSPGIGDQSFAQVATAPSTKLVDPFVLKMNAPKSIFAVGRGWGQAEKNYRWTLGRCAEIYVPYLHGFAGSATLRIAAGAYLADSQLSALMHIQINGKRLESISFGATPSEQEVLIPSDVFKSGLDRVDLIVESPQSPSDLGRSSDQRKLGFCVYTVSVTDFQPDSSGDLVQSDAALYENGSVT